MKFSLQRLQRGARETKKPKLPQVASVRPVGQLKMRSQAAAAAWTPEHERIVSRLRWWSRCMALAVPLLIIAALVVRGWHSPEGFRAIAPIGLVGLVGVSGCVALWGDGAMAPPARLLSTAAAAAAAIVVGRLIWRLAGRDNIGLRILPTG